jgi:hypothetical protein
MRRLPFVSLSVFVFVLLLVAPRIAAAAGPYAIPPGCEELVSELLERGLGPDAVRNVNIERDHIIVSTKAPDYATLFIFHPQDRALRDTNRTWIAPGVALECFEAAERRPCTQADLERWRASGQRLALARARLHHVIWTIEVGGVEAGGGVEPTPRSGRRSDQIIFIVVLALSLALVVFEYRREHGCEAVRSGPPRAVEWLGVAIALLVLVACSRGFTWPWPMHEHNSFVARAECAIDERCVSDPAAAWSPTSLHVYGVVLSGFGLGRPVAWLSWLSITSLALSVVALVLVWALARRLTLELGRPDLAPWAGLLAAGVLAVHPVHWRLAGSGSMWPLALVGALAAALAGLWAARQRETWAAALGWCCAAGWFSLVLGGNVVLLTSAVLVGLAPLAWTRIELDRAGLRRAVLVAVPALVCLVVLVESDLRYGLERAAAVESGDYGLRQVIHEYQPLLLEPQISTRVWAPLLLLSLAWLLPISTSSAGAGWIARGRLLVPILILWGVPHMFLGVAAGDLLDYGYPVGFINHHWELVGSAVLVGLGGAWALGFGLARARPSAPQRWAGLATLGVCLLGLALGPCAPEGWRFATQPSVVERELAALESVLPDLPEHDRLIVAPRILETIDGVQHRGDPIEVVFPVESYREAMRGRGRAPQRVDDFRGLEEEPVGEGERVLIYVGTSLRSYVRAEIAANVVPPELERSELTRLRWQYRLEPVLEFELPTAQHEAATMRLGADLSPTVTLGFHWLVPNR